MGKPRDEKQGQQWEQQYRHEEDDGKWEQQGERMNSGNEGNGKGGRCDGMMREQHDYDREDGNSGTTDTAMGQGLSKFFFVSLLLFIQLTTARSPGPLNNDTAANTEDHHQHPPTTMDDPASGPMPTMSTTRANQVTL